MEQIQKLWTQLAAAIRSFRENNPKGFTLIVATTVVTAALGAAFYILDPGAPVILASNLSPADRTALALRLRRHGVSFDLGADSISVPSSELRQAQELLDASPGFNGGENGFALFDHSTLGQSEFDEQVNYQRSLQGELERTIMDIHGIDSARVMLAMAQPSPFALGATEASHASVLLATARGAIIDSTLASAIAHLVAGSVHGLSADQVTVTGNDGAVLFPLPRGDAATDAMRMKTELEHRLQEKVSSLLTSIMGQGRFAVEVSADLDASKISTKQQIYGNGDHTIVSEEHSVTPAGSSVGGIPGLTSNLPAASASPAATAAPGSTPVKTASQTQTPEAARKDIVNYQPSTREITETNAPVRVRRLSVAAVLDGTYESGEFKPLSQARLEMIKGLLAAAIGAQNDRGDSVDVQSAALSRPYVPPMVINPMTQLRQMFGGNMRYLYATLGAGLLLILLVLWMLVRMVKKLFGGKSAKAEKTAKPAKAPKAEPAQAASDTLEEFTSAENYTPPTDYVPMDDSSAPPLDGSFEQVKQQINQEVEQDPEAAAAMIRRWIGSTNKSSVEREAA
ncbi:MAG TPA: flagellar basal-body MS-ring/collar protein FliF [Candidatus Binataceae bacterium]|nr:flagellar basal-body MS-ring/collar protein FliF [Candidatus Binataceae bacterium]